MGGEEVGKGTEVRIRCEESRDSRGVRERIEIDSSAPLSLGHKGELAQHC